VQRVVVITFLDSQNVKDLTIYIYFFLGGGG
jgi:hypothetical protein